MPKKRKLSRVTPEESKLEDHFIVGNTISSCPKAASLEHTAVIDVGEGRQPTEIAVIRAYSDTFEIVETNYYTRITHTLKDVYDFICKQLEDIMPKHVILIGVSVHHSASITEMLSAMFKFTPTVITLYELRPIKNMIPNLIGRLPVSNMDYFIGYFHYYAKSLQISRQKSTKYADVTIQMIESLLK